VTASRTCASKSPACSPRRSTDGELAGVRARGVARTTRTGGGRGRIALSFLYELRSSLENENPRKNGIVFFAAEPPSVTRLALAGNVMPRALPWMGRISMHQRSQQSIGAVHMCLETM
jgi:hypothetical protein